MNVKLHVEIGGDRLDVEGEHDFVEQVYGDFKRRARGERDQDARSDIAPLVALTHGKAANER